MLLPDVLVLMFVANLQNIEGIKDVMTRTVKARSKLPVNRSKLLGVPVPARDERDREYAKSVEWQRTFATTFANLYTEWLPKEVSPSDALNKLYIPYVAAWSFGESIPVIENDRERSDPSSIGAAYTRLATLLLHRLDWYAIEGKASVGDLVGTRAELSKARDEKQQAEIFAATTARRARVWILTLLVLFVVAALGGIVWYQSRPEPVSTDLLVGDRLARNGDLSGSLRVYGARRQFLEQSAATTPLDMDLQRELSIALRRIGWTQDQQGQLSDALASFQGAKAIIDRLLAKDPDNLAWQQDLARIHLSIGSAFEVQGKFDEALAQFQALKAIMNKLAADNPGNTEFQRDLAVGHYQIGNVLGTQGKLEEALASYQIDMTITRKLAESAPENAQGQRELALSHLAAGRMLLLQGKLNEALASVHSSKAIMDKAVAGSPANVDLQWVLAFIHHEIGRVLQSQGNFTQALASQQASKQIMDGLVARSAENTYWQEDLALSHIGLGRVLQAQGKPDEALASFEASTAILEKLVAGAPQYANWQRLLAESLMWRGSVKLDQRQPKEALQPLERAAEISGRKYVAGYVLAQLNVMQIQRHRVDAFLLLDDLQSARGECRGGKMSEGRAPLSASNIVWELGLTRVGMSCAEVLAREGDVSGASEEMAAAASRLKKLAAASPESDEIQRESARAGKRAVELLGARRSMQ